MKSLRPLIIVGLGLCLAGINANPAHSSETGEQKEDSVLISQLRGHNSYAGEPQMSWENYVLGRVVGKSGSWMSIKTEDGAVFQAEGSVSPGSNVLVDKDETGAYYLVSASEAEWIEILEADYGWKRNAVTQASLNERTAAIWAEIEAGSSRQTTVIPAQQASESQFIERETQVFESQPVRGLW